MNTLTDLRRTLEQHADAVADPSAVARAAAIHHRVAVVRRHRASAATFALALSLVGSSAAVLLPRSDRAAAPAAPTVLGVQAPTTLRSLGYTYRSDGRASTFGRSGTVKVHASDQPQLFSWTTSRPAAVTLVLPDGDVWHSVATHFSDFVVVPPGESGDLRVSVGRGNVGLASYDLTDAIPQGAYSKAGITYRASVANTPLLTAVVGDRGQTVLRSSFIATAGAVSVSYLCSGIPDGYWVNVALNHQGRVASGGLPCDGSGSYDAGATGGTGFPHVGKPGSRVSVKVWVSKDDEGAVLPSSAVPGLRLGAAIYGPQAAVHVGGTTVARYVEYAGHLWVWSGGVTRGRGRDLTLPADRHDRVAALAFHTHRQTKIYFAAGGSTEGAETQSTGSGALPQLWVPAAAGVHVHLQRAAGSFGVAFYRRAD